MTFQPVTVGGTTINLERVIGWDPPDLDGWPRSILIRFDSGAVLAKHDLYEEDYNAFVEAWKDYEHFRPWRRQEDA